ncbi:hypothetical protein [Nitrosomonas supralitoralis]|uniref:Uncharacterized protein n=1 Tax=Nitrosomonas supralitoralis TaxID=2116706 RepID=A0A2P7NR80_9PROT|nr:hypothetical protein [Nitrosomonas supralitoralis]PSJ15964.1 hypothetical protein C7H79_16150 [Nitrosomonas supralitoralis]
MPADSHVDAFARLDASNDDEGLGAGQTERLPQVAIRGTANASRTQVLLLGFIEARNPPTFYRLKILYRKSCQ